jgi:transglutaminase-like putative cysteine protease
METNPSYLETTHYCDYDNPAIRDLADIFKDKTNDQTELVKAVFKHVRDEVAFGTDLVKVKASDTARKGYGACWNKALLLIAVLRYYRIPSRLIRYAVKRDFQRPFTGMGYLFMNSPFYHCAVETYINNKWVKLDPTVDKKLYNTFYKPRNVPWDIQWDGNSDVITFTNKILSGPELLQDIDKSINSRVGNWIFAMYLPFYKLLNIRAWKKLGWDTLITRG